MEKAVNANELFKGADLEELFNEEQMDFIKLNEELGNDKLFRQTGIIDEICKRAGTKLSWFEINGERRFIMSHLMLATGLSKGRINDATKESKPECMLDELLEYGLQRNLKGKEIAGMCKSSISNDSMVCDFTTHHENIEVSTNNENSSDCNDSMVCTSCTHHKNVEVSTILKVEFVRPNYEVTTDKFGKFTINNSTQDLWTERALWALLMTVTKNNIGKIARQVTLEKLVMFQHMENEIVDVLEDWKLNSSSAIDSKLASKISKAINRNSFTYCDMMYEQAYVVVRMFDEKIDELEDIIRNSTDRYDKEDAKDERSILIAYKDKYMRIADRYQSRSNGILKALRDLYGDASDTKPLMEVLRPYLGTKTPTGEYKLSSKAVREFKDILVDNLGMMYYDSKNHLFPVIDKTDESKNYEWLTGIGEFGKKECGTTQVIRVNRYGRCFLNVLLTLIYVDKVSYSNIKEMTRDDFEAKMLSVLEKIN